MRKLALALLCLLAGPAAAQQLPSTLPDHTLLGRMGSGTGSGPIQAIPFASFFSGAQQFTALGLGVTAPATGMEIVGAAVSPTGNGQLVAGSSSTNGGVVGGQGSTYDAALLNKSGSVALGVPTGTANIQLGGGLSIPAGTTSIAPIDLAPGTNLTTAASGSFEYDGNQLFFSPANSDRRVVPNVAYIRQHATYTLTSQTGAQQIFNGSSAGAITLPVGNYEFEGLVALASMSGTSGNAEFLIAGGTGTVTNSLIFWTAIDAAATGAGGVAFQSGYALSANPGLSPTNMATAATNTAMGFWVRGTFEVSVAGTVIPQIALTTAAAAVVQIGSFFKATRLGATTDVASGNWQ